MPRLAIQLLIRLFVICTLDRVALAQKRNLSNEGGKNYTCRPYYILSPQPLFFCTHIPSHKSTDQDLSMLLVHSIFSYKKHYTQSFLIRNSPVIGNTCEISPFFKNSLVEPSNLIDCENIFQI